MIPIGQVGRIRAGELPGWFVIVKDDREVTRGLYVVVSSHLDFHESPHGTDFWGSRPTTSTSSSRDQAGTSTGMSDSDRAVHPDDVEHAIRM
jgi:hypothetical protein